jgi:hypothetical protein
MERVTRLIDTVQLGVFIDNLLPVTFFSAVNSAWDNIEIPTLEIEDVIKSSFFDGLWFDDQLATMDGEVITSVNGKTWQVQVFEDPGVEPLLYSPNSPPVKIYLSNTNGPEGLTNCTFLPGQNTANILARNGIIHQIDCLLLDINYTKVPPNAPTYAPIALDDPLGAPSPGGILTTAPIFPTTPPVSAPATAEDTSTGVAFTSYVARSLVAIGAVIGAYFLL